MSDCPKQVAKGLAMLKRDLGPDKDEGLNEIHDFMTDCTNPLPKEYVRDMIAVQQTHSSSTHEC